MVTAYSIMHTCLSASHQIDYSISQSVNWWWSQYVIYGS